MQRKTRRAIRRSATAVFRSLADLVAKGSAVSFKVDWTGEAFVFEALTEPVDELEDMLAELNEVIAEPVEVIEPVPDTPGTIAEAVISYLN